jgi:putative PIN family toxin of toxin-antitoxin system
VSALLFPRSVPRQAFDLAFIRGTVLVSDATVNELDEVLRRPRFERYLKEDERLQFLDTFIRDSTIVEVNEVINVCRDPKDNKFLEVAVSGNATCLISGDADLLTLDPFGNIKIITPQTFISQL